MLLTAEPVLIEWWKAVILGAVQGITEFLPISSSAHLVLIPWLFNWRNPGLTFDVALHIGTLTAVLTYFRRDIGAMLAALWRGLRARAPLAEPESRLAFLLAFGSLPGFVVGLLFDEPIDDFFHRPEAVRTALAIMATMLIVMGILLYVAERYGKRLRDIAALRFGDAAIIGVAQAFALIPGVSRSGSTLTAGLFLNLKRAEAARFSFLLSLPITGGAALKKAYDVVQDGGLAPSDRLPFALGILTAGIVGYTCIAFLLRYLQRASTMAFTIYRVAFGILILVLILVR
jgi:undecaprenyl-diphosphatase